MSKVCVIGLDGGTFKILDFLIDSKRLPNFEKVVREGSKATLLSSHPPLTPAAWVSFYTGANPGVHGAVDFFKREPDSYKLNPINANIVGGTPLWRQASHYDKKVCIYNVPVTYPVKPVNGIMISGMDAPSINEHFVYPSEMKDQLLKEVPDYMIEPMLDIKYLVNNYDDPAGEHIKKLDDYLDMQFRVMRFLQKQEDWDIFVAVIRSTDNFQHAYWREVEKVIQGEEVGSEVNRRAEAVFSCYERIDRELGENWLKWGSDRDLVIMSDHGFGILDREVCVNRILAGSGLLNFKERTISRRFKDFMIDRVARKIVGNLSPALRSRFLKLASKDRITGLMMEDTLTADIDWSKTRAYSVGQFGCIYVNLEGREPLGIVRGEKEREAVLSELEEVFWELKDPEDGKPVVTEILRGEELFTGAQADTMPDLLIVMRQYAYRGVYSTFAELSEEEIIRPSFRFRKELAPSGAHRREGILIMHGPNIKKSDLGTVDIIDVAPTINNLLGFPAPEDYDGSILKDALVNVKEESSESQKAIRPDRELMDESGEQTYSEDDENEVRKRLQDLGYI